MLEDMRVVVGTSGWQYRDWRGRFYPQGLPTTEWLPHYARSFRSVEVNASFYRLPRAETVRHWAEIVPEDFILTFKASRYLTHVLRLREVDEPLRTMWEVFRAAGPKLGPILFQLPPTFAVDVDRLGALLAAVPPEARAAFEFRHPSWDDPAVLAALDRAGCALVHADRPGVAPDLRVVGGWLYLRFHAGRRTSPGYDRRKLRRYAEAIARAGAAEAFVYFNNDTGGAAVRDARTLLDLLGDLEV